MFVNRQIGAQGAINLGPTPSPPAKLEIGSESEKHSKIIYENSSPVRTARVQP